jgi:hypothetical protein
MAGVSGLERLASGRAAMRRDDGALESHVFVTLLMAV